MSFFLTLFSTYNEISVFFFHLHDARVYSFLIGPIAGRSTTREWEPPQWWVEVSWLFPKLAILDNNNEKQAYFLVALTTSSPLWHNPYHTCLLSMLSHLCHKHWNQFSFCFSSSIASSFHSCFFPITEFSEKDNDLDRLSITLSLRYFS